LAFEKEKRNITILIVIGVFLAFAGLIMFFYGYELLGILIAILGIALIMICGSISNFLYKFRILEEMKNQRSKK
jgi:hypothetical protein